MTGEALDHKTPLLRSQQAMAAQAERVLKLFGHAEPDAVVSFAGAEQEYFLIDRSFFFSRPDLLNSGRTLFGAKPPKGQEFDDHYFGAIPERVLAFMLDAERELFKLGIPAKTRHNEVAPGQFEIAPMFERSNVATDHQQLLMVTLKRVAQKHGMECLFHEKPFAGINGSGKHVNFSLGNATEGNLLLPGDTPHDNAQFLVFCAAVIRAVHKFGGLLRASVASATNDHRLGANEAPPAIISIFLGDQLTDVFDQIAKGGATSSKEKGTLIIGVDTLPVLPDRPGRPQPHQPVRLHRQPLRVPGARARCSRSPARWSRSTRSWPRRSTTSPPSIESLVADGAEFNAAVQKVLEEIITDHGAVVFNGDGYSEDWQVEAEARGLPEPAHHARRPARSSITAEAIELFSHYGVFTDREMHSRYEIALEQYALSIGVEARLDARDGDHRRSSRRRCATRPSWPPTSPASRRSASTPTPSTLDEVVGGDRRRCGPASPTLRGRARPHDDAATTEDEADPRRHGAAAGDGGGARPPPTSSRRWSPTTCGRCRPTRRCSSSSDEVPRSRHIRTARMWCDRSHRARGVRPCDDGEWATTPAWCW